MGQKQRGVCCSCRGMPKPSHVGWRRWSGSGCYGHPVPFRLYMYIVELAYVTVNIVNIVTVFMQHVPVFLICFSHGFLWSKTFAQSRVRRCLFASKSERRVAGVGARPRLSMACRSPQLAASQGCIGKGFISWSIWESLLPRSWKTEKTFPFLFRIRSSLKVWVECQRFNISNPLGMVFHDQPFWGCHSEPLSAGFFRSFCWGGGDLSPSLPIHALNELEWMSGASSTNLTCLGQKCPGTTAQLQKEKPKKRRDVNFPVLSCETQQGASHKKTTKKGPKRTWRNSFQIPDILIRSKSLMVSPIKERELEQGEEQRRQQVIQAINNDMTWMVFGPTSCWLDVLGWLGPQTVSFDDMKKG